MRLQRVHCIDCGHPFHRGVGEAWKARCTPCWRAHRGLPEPVYRPRLRPHLSDEALERRLQALQERLREAAEAAAAAAAARANVVELDAHRRRRRKRRRGPGPAPPGGAT